MRQVPTLQPARDCVVECDGSGLRVTLDEVVLRPRRASALRVGDQVPVRLRRGMVTRGQVDGEEWEHAEENAGAAATREG